MSSHGIGHLRRYDRLHNKLLAVELAQLGPARELIAQDEGQGLVTVQQHILTLLVAQRHTQAVAIGVGSQHKVGTLLGSQLDSLHHRLALLGVGRIYGREVSIDNSLLGYDRNILETEVLQRSGNEFHTRTMDRRVDNLHILMCQHALARELERKDLVQVDLVEVVTQDGDVLGVLARQDLIHVRNLGHLLDDVLIVRSRYLRTIGPIGLVAVVLLRVVRSGYHNTRMTLQLTNREAQLGGGAECIKKEYRKAVRCEDVGYMLRELTRVVAAVVTDRHANLLAGEVFLQVVGQTLRRHTHRVDVHTVRTYAHNTAQTARTKLEVFVEAFNELLRVILDQMFYLRLGLGVIVSVKPLLGFRQDLRIQFVCHRVIGFIYS